MASGDITPKKNKCRHRKMAEEWGKKRRFIESRQEEGGKDGVAVYHYRITDIQDTRKVSF